MATKFDTSVTRKPKRARKKIAIDSVKVQMVDVIQKQPEDASYEEIMRELAFERMVQRGLDDSRAGRTISSKEMARRIKSWGK